MIHLSSPLRSVETAHTKPAVRKSSNSNPSSPRRRKLLRWVVGLLLAYAIVGFLIVPPIIRVVAVKQLRQLLGREVSIEKVRVNPFALSGSICGFLVKDLDGEPLLSWDEA